MIMEFAYDHVDVIFLVTLIFVVIAQQVFGGPTWQRLFGPPLAAVTIYTLLATERRAGYIALMVAFIALAIVFLVAHRKAFFCFAVPVLLAGAIYMPVFWNNTGMVGQPARAVRSLFNPDPRDAQSNLSRELEKLNVFATIRAAPLLGVGFGREYLIVAPGPDISWFVLWNYEPHHNVLWIWLKTGAAGFVVFWLLMGTSIARAGYFAKTLRVPELRTFAILSLVGVVTTLVFSYVDLGLTAGRVPVFLGTLMGALAVLDRVRE
jgi:hypothetical protein